MQAQTRQRLTPEEYLAIERAAEYKSEYYNGEMFAMAGASSRHSRIVTNLSTAFDTQLVDRDCDVYTNDIRVKIESPERFTKYTYTDVIVVCGHKSFEDGGLDTLTNPTVIIEVLSESTEAYDRGKKFEHYRRLESLREYALVAQDRFHVECYQRQQDGTWRLQEFNERDDEVVLESIACHVPLRQVYRRVDFDKDNE